MGHPIHNLHGQEFGHWQVIRLAVERDKYGYAMWWCRCRCGQLAKVRSGNLIRQHSRQCRRCSNQRQGGKVAATASAEGGVG